MFSTRIDRKYLELGADSFIDPTVLIGEIPERPLDNPVLKIGRGARIRSHSVIYAGSKIGDYLSTGHNVIIREENLIGDHVSIWSNSIVDYGCRIGQGVKIHSSVYLCQFTVVEDDAFLAPGVITGNDPHPGCPKSRECLRGPLIQRGAQIGLNATILPYVTIGAGALIGAGSVITKDIPAGKVAFGNPARIICDREALRCRHSPPWIAGPYRTR
jgi:acetyltransferase-like isoleucine patch superfamily enzyme